MTIPLDAAAMLWLKPELFLAVLGLLLLGLAAVVPREVRSIAGIVALFGILFAGFLVVSYFPSVPVAGPKILDTGAQGAFPDGAGRPAILADGFSLVLKLIVLAGGFLTALAAMRLLDIEKVQSGEFYALIAFALVGLMLLASGADLATLFIGLETTALSSYVLVGYTKANPKSNEAALKYFLLGAFASAVFVFGVSLVYGATGSFHLDGIAAACASPAVRSSPLLAIGAVLILAAMSFKIAAAPFHMWAPDAYEGATAPVIGFLSTAAKAGAFAMLARMLIRGFHPLAAEWTPMLALLAAASMTLGNLTALRQENVKRMLAYSSIAHAGYVLMGLVVIAAAPGDATLRRHGLTAIVLYLLVYTFTNIGAFGLVALLRRDDVAGDRVDDFRGLSRSHPLAAAAMVVFLLSLAGIPCTAGFIGKWWLFGAAIRADFVWLAVVAVINSAISLYYYARIAVAMYMTSDAEGPAVRIPVGLAAVLVIATAFTLAIGLYPQPVIRLAQLAFLPLGAQ